MKPMSGVLTKELKEEIESIRQHIEKFRGGIKKKRIDTRLQRMIKGISIKTDKIIRQQELAQMIGVSTSTITRASCVKDAKDDKDEDKGEKETGEIEVFEILPDSLNKKKGEEEHGKMKIDFKGITIEIS